MQKSLPNTPLRERMSSTVRSVDSTIQLVRRIASELRPSLLDNLGLIAAIEWQLQEFEKRTRIRYKLECGERTLDLDWDRSTALYRVTQEALTNVMRHSGATSVTVAINRTERAVLLSIIDNGKGITDRDINRSNSLGLLGMRERMAQFGGKCVVERHSAGGTSVRAWAPIS
jgi:signal transduction histidine kinase